MTTPNDILALNIEKRLRLISAQELQVMAEDMAAITCPHMFKDEPLLRQGRSINAQTTKNWPDAYVQTGDNTVHGVEATRDQQSWAKHLAADLGKAKDPKNFNLSGYFFVGGYPEHDPPEADITKWAEKFIALGIEAKNVKLLIGKHLALELVDPKYARIRQIHLSLPSSPEYFEEIRDSIIRKSMGALATPTEADFLNGIAFKPTVADSVTIALSKHGVCEVRGHGACGKTTLAHWIGVAPGFRTTPIYRLDLATWDDDAPAGKIRNEMTALSGKDVVFIIDNVHVNEGASHVLADHWRHCCKPLGSRLLLLGRKNDTRGHSFGAPLLQMKAGAAEVNGIVKFLMARAGKPIAMVPPTALDQWLLTFGGRRERSSAGVDLIAFAAAAGARTDQLARGDFRLSEKDAIDAVQQHYLRPIQSDQSRANLLRLAVLSELEFPIPASVLPFSSAGFGRECSDRGLVVSKNGAHSLAHPALGRLLSAAASTNVSKERLAAATCSAVLTARMLGRGLFPHERTDLLKQLRQSLATGQWLDSCTQLHDVSSVLAVGVRLDLIDPRTSDELISKDARLTDLTHGARSLETFTSVAGHLRSRSFPKTASRILDFTSHDAGEPLVENLMQGSAGQVLAFLKNVPSPEIICSAIDMEKWRRSRESVAIDLASSTAQLARFVDRAQNPALATAPARQFILRAERSNFFNSDLGDVSNIVRYARAEDAILCKFFERLIGTGWLPQAYLSTILGQLCGGLMSFANHLPLATRQLIQLPEVGARIAKEASQLTTNNPASVARFICLLGASAALWGNSFKPIAWRWPHELSSAEVFNSRAPSIGEGEEMGMYELQFWLGMRWLSMNDGGPPSWTEPSIADSFLYRLEKSTPPSSEGVATRNELMHWLRARQAVGWDLTATRSGTRPPLDSRRPATS